MAAEQPQPLTMSSLLVSDNMALKLIFSQEWMLQKDLQFRPNPNEIPGAAHTSELYYNSSQ